jgi:hypothetical protein
MARPERLELPTPRSVVWCSIQLSYGRFARARGFNRSPTTGQGSQPARRPHDRLNTTPAHPDLCCPQRQTGREESHGTGQRTGHHAQGRMASLAIPWHRLLHQRARPHQRCDRGVDHEQVTRLLRRPVWSRRRRVLLELHPVPSTQQRHAGPHRRATLDHHHHARMGSVFSRNSPGVRRDQLRDRAIHAGCGGGRLLLRRDLLHDPLVPRPASVHGHGSVLRLRGTRRLHRFADLGQHPRAARVAWLARVAVDLPA